MTKKDRVLIWQIAAIFFGLTFVLGCIFNSLGSILLYALIAYIALAWIITFPSSRKEEQEALKQQAAEQLKQQDEHKETGGS